MIIEVKVPTPGESITEVELSNWLVADGDLVRKDQELAEVESDKATLSLIAPESGKITFLIQAGQTVKVNSIACTIDTSVEVPDAPAAPAPQPASKPAAPVDQAKPASVASASTTKDQADPVTSSKGEDVKIRTTPLARSMMAAENLSADEVLKGLKRLSSKEVGLILALREGRLDAVSVAQSTERTEERKAMTQLRKQLSKRLVR